VFEDWRQTTHWGRLFGRYQADGTLGGAAATTQAG
jgi:hypothetical protein